MAQKSVMMRLTYTDIVPRPHPAQIAPSAAPGASASPSHASRRVLKAFREEQTPERLQRPMPGRTRRPDAHPPPHALQWAVQHALG